MKLGGDAPCPNRRSAFVIAGESEEGWEKSIKRAVRRFRALTRLHVGVPVPQFAASIVGEIFVDRRDARVPHVAAFRVTEQKPAFPEIFVVRVDAATDMAITVRPGSCLNVNALTDEAERRATLVGLDQSALGLVVEDGLAGQFTQCAKLKEQRPRFRRIRHRLAHLAGTKVDINVRESCRRIEGRQQSGPQIFGQLQEAFVARQLVAGE